MGGSLFVSAANSAFDNTLVARIVEYAPGVDPQVVVAAGATGLRQVLTDAQLPGVLEAYMSALKTTFILTIACTGTAMTIAFFSSWKSIKGKMPMGAA